jgi:hypothetical protein
MEEDKNVDTTTDYSILAGDYCGMLFYQSIEDGGNFIIENKGKDTLTFLLSGMHTNTDLLKFDFTIKNDSIIIPEQEIVHKYPEHWEYSIPIKGRGSYSSEKNKISFLIKRLDGDSLSEYSIEITKSENVDLKGTYKSSNSQIRSVQIESGSLNDSLNVTFLMDYKDKVDSALINFKIDNYECKKFVYITVDKENSISGFIEHTDNYLNIELSRCKTNPNMTTCKPDYYIFKGFRVIEE